MSLVAYESSEDSENEEETEQQPRTDVIPEPTPYPGTSKSSEVQEPDKGAEVNFDISDESDGEVSDAIPATINFDIVPKPKKLLVSDKEIEEADKLPLPKKIDYGDSIPAPPKKTKGPVKIFIPSLSEFKDDEDDSPQNKVKRTPAQGSCALLSLLPPAKSGVTTPKITSMVPHVLTKKPEEPKPPTIPLKKPTPHTVISLKPNPGVLKPTAKHHSDSEDDEEELSSSIDFFSLTKPIKVPEALIKPLSNEELQDITATPLIRKAATLSSVANDQPEIEVSSKEEQHKTLVSNVMNLPREEILQKNKSDIGPKLPVPEQEYHVDQDGNIAFDEKAIEYLCGKRGVKRREEFSNVDIVEISGEDMKPDERDWLVKALTEDPIHRPISMGAGPSGTSKKKHQITYLAHQAKAMEHELKNQWAQNKASRQQTRSKYGF
ncbi:hypothetical protein QAD02_003924 [Eretmocerus hayati]|uniref:Uncharacterized protein n=1 Tax=Eretmocerus hayati TaxID=131215 RepID=A0ACC2NN99_9HYME|nr:hypothetical protein QAD02_003924 [Eretmocerus hayati]